MDVCLFLELPVDIRRNVYYHLAGDFCGIVPAPVQQLYYADGIRVNTANEKRSKNQDLLHAKYHRLFAPYLGIFDYSPSLVGEWLEYSLWLRYDSIVLDCLRLNNEYGGSLIGIFECIYLDNKVRLAYFKNCMLLVWYTLREYARWIAKEEFDDDNHDDVIENRDSFRLNLEYMTSDSMKKILASMKHNDMLPSITEVFIEQECDEDLGAFISKTPEEVTFQVSDFRVNEIIANMETLKNLNKIIIRGGHLFEALINFHGVRDNPGKTINYIVKKRILRVELWQIDDLTKTGLADFSRWENLRDLRLIKVGVVDLNKVVLPARCQILILKDVSTVRWWELESEIKRLTKVSFIVKPLNNYTNLKSLDRSSMDLDSVGQCQSMTWQKFKQLNFLRLQNVKDVIGGKIVVPHALYSNKRIQIFPRTVGIKEIIVV